ncbi:MAG TPA: HD domain-containing protein [archaeon]|nr:HD domain-containing protein [archaeon]
MDNQEEIAEFWKEFREHFGENEDAAKAFRTISNVFRLANLNEGIYKSHNIGVARIMLKLGMDMNTVVAAILHNTLDHGMSIAELEAEFGKEIAELVDSKARFEKALEVNPLEKESSTKKMMVVLTTNPNVVILQLGEALDKLRKIENIPEGERRQFLWQAKEVFAPLAHKLNIYSISTEMKELAFRYEEPKTYNEIENEIRSITSRTSAEIENAKSGLEYSLKAAKIHASIFGRVKTAYSTHEKMKRKNVGIRGIYDLMALRVITDSIKDCYEVLGIVHSMWKPVPGEFDDYIAKPKENGYKSLHTSVFTQNGTPIEIQIRTKEMHDFAEFGIASHWAYKGEKKDSKHDRKIEWIKQVLDWQRGAGGKTEMDIFGKEVFAMTPKGQVIELPEGASIIDFAYAVHSDIGDKCVGGKINGNMVSLNTTIRNGDVVEILTSSKQKPKMSWLSFSKSGKAQQKIRAKLNIGKAGSSGSALRQISAGAIKTDDNRVRLAKCCSPLPGDEIIGIRTTKRKISVHRADCSEALKDGAKKTEVFWDEKSAAYETNIIVQANDRLGILRDILHVFSHNKIYLKSANAKASASGKVTCVFIIRLKNLGQYEETRKKIIQINGVNEVYRE